MSGFILFSGFAGLLAGALSMGAGEYVSVRSQRELLSATRPTQITLQAAPDLDLNANELVLVYRARGMTLEAAEHRAAERMGYLDCDCDPSLSLQAPETYANDYQEIGTGWNAAVSSFLFFSSGALIPILPYIFGLQGTAAVVVALLLGRPGATGDRRNRGTALRCVTAQACPATAGDRFRRGTGHLRFGLIVRYRRSLTSRPGRPVQLPAIRRTSTVCPKAWLL